MPGEAAHLWLAGSVGGVLWQSSGHDLFGTALSIRRRLLTAARSEIMEHGVAAATLTRVAERAGVDAEALHREFADQHALLVAVHEEVTRELNGAALSAARAVDAHRFAPIEAGCRRMFELYVADGAGRHVIHAIRHTLTLGEWQELDRRFGVSALLGGLRPLADQGVLPVERIEELAVVLYGLVTEACVSVADGQAALTGDDVVRHVHAVLEAAAKTPGATDLQAGGS